jgi:hypothetical protein
MTTEGLRRHSGAFGHSGAFASKEPGIEESVQDASRESADGLRCDISARGRSTNKARDSVPGAESEFLMVYAILRSTCHGAALHATLVLGLLTASSVNAMLLLSHLQQ